MIITVMLLVFNLPLECSDRPAKSNLSVFPITKSSDSVLRVITYNIRGDCAIDYKHGNSWSLRKDKINALLQRYHPDLLGLQEVSTSYMPDLLSIFYNYHSIAFDVSEKYKDVVLLVHKERFDIQKKYYFWISQKQIDKNPHLTIVAQLFDRYSKQTFFVFCTHFDSGAERGVELRIQNALNLIKEQGKISENAPLIVMGDFNLIMTTPLAIKKNNEVYRMLTKKGDLRDVRDISMSNNYGPDGTWIGWRYDNFAALKGTVGERLDHVFVRKFEVLQEGVLNLKISSMGNQMLSTLDNDFNKIEYPSDHLPVIVDLKYI